MYYWHFILKYIFSHRISSIDNAYQYYMRSESIILCDEHETIIYLYLKIIVNLMFYV